jgi:hypothetical protein
VHQVLAVAVEREDVREITEILLQVGDEIADEVNARPFPPPASSIVFASAFRTVERLPRAASGDDQAVRGG